MAGEPGRGRRRGIVLLSIGGLIAGALLWVGFNKVLDYTNTVEFCISCHEMEKTVYAEWKGSIHYSNRTGVRAVCSDCHVPKEFGPKMLRKLFAVNDIYMHYIGGVDTPEKLLEKRGELAERVWDYMAASNSRECRTCHAFDAMNLDKQGPRPRDNHPKAMREGKTCINCHRGVAHQAPRRDE